MEATTGCSNQEEYNSGTFQQISNLAPQLIWNAEFVRTKISPIPPESHSHPTGYDDVVMNDYIFTFRAVMLQAFRRRHYSLGKSLIDHNILINKELGHTG